MSGFFGALFTFGVIGFLVVYGFALYLINRRLSHLEEMIRKWRYRK